MCKDGVPQDDPPQHEPLPRGHLLMNHLYQHPNPSRARLRLVRHPGGGPHSVDVLPCLWDPDVEHIDGAMRIRGLQRQGRRLVLQIWVCWPVWSLEPEPDKRFGEVPPSVYHADQDRRQPDAQEKAPANNDDRG